MNIYLVGGAVRDELLGLPVVDRDWVVTGSSTEQMLAAGYKSVGKDFPVFLHPDTHEEYALARMERKTGPGYHGFTFKTEATVTLEDDLSRRDLTINAIAKSQSGELIDPFNGAGDLKKRILRHVSDAFVEDPVRVLRVARFMARLANQGFTVAKETMQLMRSMAQAGEVNNLVAERVWQEMHSALSTTKPMAFFETLRECDALAIVLPELDKLHGIPQRKQWHPEIDCFVHTMMVLEQATIQHESVAIRFAALCHDLGKAVTPADILPSHHGHEERGAVICDRLCDRLRIPKKLHELASLTARYHTHCHRAMELSAKTMVKTLRALDVKRKPVRFNEFVNVCKADARGRLGFEQCEYPQADFLTKAAAVFCAVDTTRIAKNAQHKSRIAEAIYEEQVGTLKKWLTDQR